MGGRRLRSLTSAGPIASSCKTEKLDLRCPPQFLIHHRPPSTPSRARRPNRVSSSCHKGDRSSEEFDLRSVGWPRPPCLCYVT